MSVIRDNLMTQPGYTPYCGSRSCKLHWPRSYFDGEQFACNCGWRSEFEPKFIAEYKAKWNLK